MIYQLHISVNGVKNISRTIYISSQDTFEQLHIYIQNIFGLSNIHMYDFKYKDEFFVSKMTESMKQNFAMGVSLYDDDKSSDGGLDSGSDLNMYDQLGIDESERDLEELANPTNYDVETTKLFQIRDNPEYKELEYLYDFNDYWTMNIRLDKKIESVEGKLPKIISSQGGYLIEDCGGPTGYNELIAMQNKGQYDEDLFETSEDFEEYIKPISAKVKID